VLVRGFASSSDKEGCLLSDASVQGDEGLVSKSCTR